MKRSPPSLKKVKNCNFGALFFPYLQILVTQRFLPLIRAIFGVIKIFVELHERIHMCRIVVYLLHEYICMSSKWLQLLEQLPSTIYSHVL